MGDSQVLKSFGFVGLCDNERDEFLGTGQEEFEIERIVG